MNKCILDLKVLLSVEQADKEYASYRLTHTQKLGPVRDVGRYTMNAHLQSINTNAYTLPRPLQHPLCVKGAQLQNV